MKVIELECSNCGAPLEVPLRRQKLATCEFCGSKKLLRPDEAKKKPRSRDPELNRLDEGWRQERRNMRVRARSRRRQQQNRNQNRHVFSVASGGETVGAGASGLAFFISLLTSMPPAAKSLFILLGLGCLGLFFYLKRNRDDYQRRRRRFRRARMKRMKEWEARNAAASV